MIATSHKNWYAVQTQPNAEMKAVAHLARQDFEVYLPRFLKRRRHAGGWNTFLKRYSRLSFCCD